MAALCKIPVGLALALREAGIPERAVLARAGLPPDLFSTQALYVPARDYFALWQAIRDVSGKPNVGIQLATLVRPDVTEPLFLAILSAANVRDALSVVSTFKRMLEPEELHVVHDSVADRVEVLYEWPDGQEPPAVLRDAELAFLVQVCRMGTGDHRFAPREVRLVSKTVERGAGHRAFFRCDVRTGTLQNGLVLAANDLERPFVTFNPQLSAALVPYLEAHTPRRQPSTASRVRTVLAGRLRGQRPSIDAVGRVLAMSGRKLQRLLRDEGTAFRDLLDEVRNEHARSYLQRSAFSDGEIAFLLGYENRNSFHRAFRAWNGVSPGELRRQLSGT